MNNPYRHAGEKLLESVGEALWPLAMVYFDPKTRGLKAGVLSTGAELLVGHGRRIGVIIEARARELCKSLKPLRSGSAQTGVRGIPVERPNPPRPADSAGSE